MSENLQDIEDLFHDSIEEHEETPPESVWDSIDHKLDKSIAARTNKKYSRLKRLSAILLLFLLGAIAYELLTKTGHPDNKKFIVVNGNDKIEPVMPAAAAKRDLLRNDKIKEKTISPNPLALNRQNKALPGSEAGELPPGAKAGNRLINPTIDTGVEHKKILSQSSVAHEIDGPTNNATTKNYALKTPEDAPPNSNNRAFKNHTINISAAEEKSKSKRSQLSKTAVKVIANKKLQSVDDRLQPSSDKVANDESNTGTENEIERGPVSIRTARNPENSRLVTAPAFIPLNMNFDVTMNETGRRSVAANTNAAPLPVTKKQRQFHFALTPFFAPQFNFNHIVDDDDHPANGQRQNDLDDIKNGENDKSSYSLGLLMEIPLKKRWFLQTGLTYINKTVEIEPKKIYADLDNGAVKYRFDFSSGYTYLNPKTGTTPLVGDSILATESSSNLQYIGIPITVNYTFFKGKFNIIPSVGAGVNFLISEKMQTNVLTGTSSDKQNITAIQGLKKVYFNTITGIAFQYNAGKKISVNLTPSANFALGPINRTTAVKSYPNSFNIAAGVKIYF
jgi:hypothetical protein